MIAIRRFPIHNLSIHTYRSYTYTRLLYQQSIGLFGLSELHSPEDFIILADKAVTKCKSIQNEIDFHLGKNHPSKTLEAVDSISNEICSVIDAAELCRNAHTSSAYRKQADKAFNLLSSFINELNSDVKLYQKIADIMYDENTRSSLTDEERIFGWDMLQEFETEGVHIKGKKERMTVASLQERVTSLESTFLQNISSSSPSSSCYLLGPLDSDQCHRMSQWLSLYGVSQPDNLPENYISMTRNKQLSGFLIRYIPDEFIRKKIWQESINEPSSNRQVLGALIATRHRLAKSIGFESFGHKNLSRKVLRTPEEVQKLLTHIAEAIRPQVKKELSLLTELKQDLIKSGSLSTNIRELVPWDVPLLSDMYTRSETSDTSDILGSDVDKKVAAANDLREFMSWTTCLNGLSHICSTVFGINMVQKPLQKGEGWVDTDSGLLKYEFFVKATNAPLGTLYIDPYSRPNKFSGAAHFTVRCGCTKEASEDSNQLPIVALLFNFPPPLEHEELQLNLQQLETLYHELGHGIHSLLSRTKFQHLSGTRGSTDFVEVPSHLFEYFARTTSVIMSWAKHSKTGDPPLAEIVDDALSLRNEFAGIELQTQILYAAADQYAFGSGVMKGLDVSCYPSQSNENKGFELAVYDKLCRGITDIQSSHTDLPLVPKEFEQEDSAVVSTINLLSHTHFVNYAGTYYSYLFARLHAAQIWHTRFASDPLSRRAGEMLWHEMLQYGASKPPLVMLEKLGKGKLNASYLLDGM